MTTDTPERFITVGVAVLSKKYRKHNFNLLPAPYQCVSLTLEDLRMGRLQELGIDILLHKIPDFDISTGELGSICEELRLWRGVVIDPVERGLVLLDREKTCALLQWFTSCHPPLSLPPTQPYDMELACKLNFPVIRKPVVACGVEGAHDMCLLHDISQIQPAAINTANVDGNGKAGGAEYILQEFIPHHGVLYKVYVIGEALSIQLRPSLTMETMNFECELESVPNEPLSFPDRGQENGIPEPLMFSSQGFKHQSGPLDEATKTAAYARLGPIQQEIREFTGRLQKELGLELFGWDLILEEHSGKPFIIDVNYFPGYDDVDFLHLLKTLLDNSIRL